MITFKHALHGDAELLHNERLIVSYDLIPKSIEFRLRGESIRRISSLEDAGLTKLPSKVFREYGYTKMPEFKNESYVVFNTVSETIYYEGIDEADVRANCPKQGHYAIGIMDFDTNKFRKI